MKKRLLSLVLCLVMVFSLMPFAASAAGTSAEAGNPIFNPAEASDETGNLKLTKELSMNDSDGTYDITLKSWATATVETEIIPEQVPTDFVLVLDQSGSMSTTDMPTGFTKVNQTNFTTQNIVDAVNDNDPYYFLAADGKYYEVHERDAGTYSQLSGIHIYQQDGVLGWGAKEGLTQMETPFVARTNVTGDGKTTEAYYLYKGVYYRLSVYAVGLPLHFQGTPFFTDANGTRHNLKTYAYTWGVGNIIVNPEITDTIYKKTSTAYRLYYLDETGTAVDIGSKVNNRSTTAYSGDLYKKNADESRLSALQTSVNTFIDSIASQKNADGSRVDHRVAIVGFASGNQRSGQTSVGNTSYYEVNEYGTVIGQNTELFDGATQKNYFTDNLQDADYLAALKSTDQAGVQQLKASVDALEANGATFPNYGLQMAEHVFTSRGEAGSQYTKLDGVTKDNRNMVVVMFTDGVPGLNDYDNQFRAANNVVAESKTLKDMNAEVYTVGVFSQDDTHPLQYSLKKYDTTTNSYSETAASQPNFLYSELETYTNGNYAFTYYMFRGNNTMENNGTDTVGHYMRVVSSDYENATAFMDSNTPNPSTGITGRGTATSDTHYMRASDTKALENVFKTIATSIHHTETPVGVDSHAVLKDVIDLEHFAPSDNYSVEAYTVLGTTTDDQEYHFGTTKMETLTPDPNTPDGTVAVSGFDYSEHHISSLSGQNGRQLIVKIKGLVPVTSADRLTSNSGTAKVEVNKDGKQVDVVTIGSPATKIGEKTYIIDFGAEMKVAGDATNVKQDNREIPNGSFSLDTQKNEATYKLNGGLNAKGNLFEASYSGVDTAMVFGKPVPVDETATKRTWTKITTVPANNIYYDDELTQLTATETGSGFNSGIVGADSANDIDKGKQLVFTFTGDRIDIFCNTTSSSNFFSANLYGSDGATAAQDVDGKSFYLITGASTDDLANIPVLSVRMRTVGTYVLKLNVGVQTNFSLDGVRVYNTMGKNADAASAYIAAKENNATFTQVRQILLNTDKVPFSLPEGMDSVIGALYRDKDKDQPYAKSGPKNEVYLDGGTGDQAKHEEISFIIDGYNAETQKIMIGLSAPKSNTVSAESPADVLVTYGDGSTTTLHVQSQTHMYYEVTPTSDGKVVIKNTSSTLISIDNVKITDNQPTRNVLGAPKFMVNRALLAYADEFDTLPVVESNIVPEDPGTDPGTEPGDEPGTGEEPSPEPTHQPSLSELIQQFFSNFVKNLFGSISRLFGN